MVKRIASSPTPPVIAAAKGAGRSRSSAANAAFKSESKSDSAVLPSPGLKQAPVLDRMCSQFVLTLTVKHAGKFNLRRDFNGLLSFTGRHLVWPVRVLGRLRDYLKQRCQGNELWSGHEALSHEDFLQRYGVWTGPFTESHPVLLSGRVRQGRTQGHAGLAGHHQRMAGPPAQARIHLG